MIHIPIKFFTIFLGMFLFFSNTYAQCTTLGQTPQTAFPVCGTSVFYQSEVPLCQNASVTIPGCGGSRTTDKNPFYYTFTCIQTGSLAFTINPIGAQEDYDWQLYDVTNITDLNTIYTNASLIVTGNWSGSYGATGTSSIGVNYIQCGSLPRDNKPTFAAMPTVTQGRTYILLVSHFTNNQSGYTLSFSGGTAIINDPKPPKLLKSKPFCDAERIQVITNKKIQCSSLTATGSEFEIVGATQTIISATTACANKFDFDSITLQLSAPLSPGNYTLRIKTGSDNNTLLDVCGLSIPQGDIINFSILPPPPPTLIDSIVPLTCATDSIKLVFKKNMRCNSIAANGSDFKITGTYLVNITGCTLACNADNLTPTIVLHLDRKLYTGGSFSVQVITGSDGTTIVDECGQTTPLGNYKNFATKDTVNADFQYSITYGCEKNTVNFSHNGAHQVNNWLWTFENLRTTSNLQNPVIIFPKNKFLPENVLLIVSNGVCSDTTKQTIVFENYMKAAFTSPDYLCPQEPANFVDASLGKISGHKWLFANGNLSTSITPPSQQFFSHPTQNLIVTNQLITSNSYGCFDTAKRSLTLPFSCFVAVPSAFTPNDDGLNDYLYPLVGYQTKNLNFRIYNRFGQLVFEGNDWQQKWNGRFKGEQQPAGTYVWTLEYINTKTNKKITQKGSSILIR